MDYVEQYRATQQRMLDIADGLSDEQSDLPVPGCPGWSVRDVYAHVTANITDGLSGRISGPPDDEFTAGQVEERRGMTLAEICDEWRSHDAALDAMLRALQEMGAVPILLDQWTHEQDVAGTLGIVSGRDEAFMRWAAATIAGRRPRPTAVSDYEFLRAAFGRRSDAQVAAWDWTGVDDPERYLRKFRIFGVAAHDIVEPDIIETGAA